MGAGNSGKVLQQELELSGPQSTWSGRDKRERERAASHNDVQVFQGEGRMGRLAL